MRIQIDKRARRFFSAPDEAFRKSSLPGLLRVAGSIECMAEGGTEETLSQEFAIVKIFLHTEVLWEDKSLCTEKLSILEAQETIHDSPSSFERKKSSPST